jgi:SAM-dependent methyltransferase
MSMSAISGATARRVIVPSLDSDYPRYLASKRSVDDRSINGRVLGRLADELDGRDRVDVLVLGAGIGGTIERFVERAVFPTDATIECTVVDIREANVRTARDRLPEWARSRGYGLEKDESDRSAPDTGSRNPDGIDPDARLRIDADGRTVDVSLVVDDAFSVVTDGEWDLLVGQAFLDLFDLEAVLPSLLSALAPGGYCYFPITFDGGTAFEPPVDAIGTDRLTRAFHEHIDRDGDVHAGRHLLTRLPAYGASVLAAGSSDWVVRASNGTYPAEEDLFLRFIVDMVAEALTESETNPLPTVALSEWRRARHDQIDRGELVYIAHQLDVLGRVDH